MGGWRHNWPLGAACVLAITMLAMCWPGVAEYDSVEQFRQALTGQYDDWHPPEMARLWAGLHWLFGGGGAPMLVAQVAAYWLGLGLIAGALARIGRSRAAGAVLVLGALPVFVVWQITILKDAQMLGAALGGVGVVAWWRLRGRAVPWAAWATAAILLGYAMLVRANSVFAIAPLVVMLAPVSRWWVRVPMMATAVLAVLALTPVINTTLLGAEQTDVRSTQPVYDLSGIAVRVEDPAATGLTPAEVATLRTNRCVKGYFWDPLGNGPCADAVEELRDQPSGTLYVTLAGAALRHPLAYAAQRLAHLNSTNRWLVGSGLPDNWGALGSEPNQLGLGQPAAAAPLYIDATRFLGETPMGWPIAWTVLAVSGLVVAGRRTASPMRDLALALLVSAVAMEASFAAISIASDLRYHLWSMMAAGLGVILVWSERRPTRRTLMVSGLFLAVVVAGGTISRLALPRAPSDYTAMLAS